MELNNKISYENLLAALLLRFGKVNVVDINLIIDDLYEKHGIRLSKFATDYKGLVYNVMYFQDSFYPMGDDAKEVLESKQSEFARQYVASLNIEELTLLKINKYGSVPEYNVSNLFNEEQERTINKLIDDLMVIYVWNNDIPYEDYQEIQLTSIGKARIFKLTYKEQVEEFIELLKNNGYDYSLIDSFLRTQDFNKEVYEILNIDNFLLYCSTYDRCATLPTDSGVTFKKN